MLTEWPYKWPQMVFGFGKLSKNMEFYLKWIRSNELVTVFKWFLKQINEANWNWNEMEWNKIWILCFASLLSISTLQYSFNFISISHFSQLFFISFHFIFIIYFSVVIVVIIIMIVVLKNENLYIYFSLSINVIPEEEENHDNNKT